MVDRSIIATINLTGLVPGIGVIHFDVESDSDSGAQKLGVFILLLYSSYCFLVLHSRFEQFVQFTHSSVADE